MFALNILLFKYCRICGLDEIIYGFFWGGDPNINLNVTRIVYILFPLSNEVAYAFLEQLSSP
jgi:hypothetical protein